MMGGGTTRNMYSSFPDKMNCVTLHLVGYILECAYFIYKSYRRSNGYIRYRGYQGNQSSLVAVIRRIPEMFRSTSISYFLCNELSAA
jgi:hypothetical protein